MDGSSQSEALKKTDSRHKTTGVGNMALYPNAFQGPQVGQNPSQPFFNSLKNRQSHSWHSGFGGFFTNTTRTSNHMDSDDQARDTSELSTGPLGEVASFTSPDELVKTFTSITPPGNLSFPGEVFCAIRSPTFRKPNPGDFKNSRTFLTKLSLETDLDPLYPMFSPRLTSTPVVSPLRTHSFVSPIQPHPFVYPLQQHPFVSPLPPTPRHVDHSLLSPSRRHQRLGRRRLLFPSEDEEAVYYLITKYLLPMDDVYSVY